MLVGLAAVTVRPSLPLNMAEVPTPFDMVAVVGGCLPQTLRSRGCSLTAGFGEVVVGFLSVDVCVGFPQCFMHFFCSRSAVFTPAGWPAHRAVLMAHYSGRCCFDGGCLWQLAMFAVAIIVPAARTMVRQASLETVVRFFISWLQCWCCSCAAAFDHVAADISEAPLHAKTLNAALLNAG